MNFKTSLVIIRVWGRERHYDALHTKMTHHLVKIDIRLTFIEITLRLGCYPVNLLCFSRTLFSKNTFGGLLLQDVTN